MKSTTELRTAAFHQAFGHPVRVEPQTLSREEALLALRLIEEEYRELAMALFPNTKWAGWTEDGFESLADLIEDSPEYYRYDPSLIEVADALGDLDVVINGAGLRHGLDMDLISMEVHRSNMSKLGPDGKPLYRADGKILKGPGFTPPNLAAVLGL